MTLSLLMKAIKKAPIENTNFGKLSEEVEISLDEINTELMKRGTLSAEDIDWKKVEASVISLFGVCLHLYGYVAAILLIARTPSQTHLKYAIEVVEHVLDHGWPNAHPNGPRAKRHKEKFLSDFLNALKSHIEEVIQAERTLSAKTYAALTAIGKRLAKLKLPVDTGELQKTIALAQTPPEPVSAPMTSDGSFKKRELDAKERAEMRRSIKSMADTIFQFDPAMGVSFTMRGYAAWLEHWQEIPAEEGKVQQYPMPANIQDEHTKAATAPSLSTVMRLEDRLFHSPDWMEGQKLLFSMLIALEYHDAAAAVRTRVHQRITRRPELKVLKYANGTDIVPKEIDEWSAQSRTVLKVQDPNGEEEHQIGAGEQLLAKLTSLDKALSHSTPGRDTHFKRLDFAQELFNAGLVGQTYSILLALELEIEQETLRDWDPEFFQRLQNLKERSLAKTAK